MNASLTCVPSQVWIWYLICYAQWTGVTFRGIIYQSTGKKVPFLYNGALPISIPWRSLRSYAPAFLIMIAIIYFKQRYNQYIEQICLCKTRLKCDDNFFLKPMGLWHHFAYVIVYEHFTFQFILLKQFNLWKGIPLLKVR